MIDFAALLSSTDDNGEMIIGIGAGIDAALVEDQKLRISNSKPKYDEAAAFALSFIPINPDPFIEDLIVSAVCAVFYYGCVDEKNPDVLKVDVQIEGAYDRGTVVIKESLRKVMTLICATKLNFFSTNHHTGQGTLSGLPLKIFNSFYDPDNTRDMTPVLCSTIHMIGHWACTRHMLHTIGIPGIGKSTVRKGFYKLGFSPDFDLRKGVMPAGTAALSLCYAIIKKMKGTRLIYAIEDEQMITKICTTYWTVFKNRPAYHMSAKLLTGADRIPFDDNEFAALLGFLGSFIHTFYPTSSICKSPKIKRGEKLVYKEYETYSEDFESLCIAVKRAMAKGTRGDIDAYLPTVATNDADRIALIDKVISENTFK